jgi:hypothetical protein
LETENLGNLLILKERNFPFINDENEIYFASDGHPGLGGLDVFMSKISAEGTLAKCKMGPISILLKMILRI